MSAPCVESDIVSGFRAEAQQRRHTIRIHAFFRTCVFALVFWFSCALRRASRSLLVASHIASFVVAHGLPLKPSNAFQGPSQAGFQAHSMSFPGRSRAFKDWPGASGPCKTDQWPSKTFQTLPRPPNGVQGRPPGFRDYPTASKGVSGPSTRVKGRPSGFPKPFIIPALFKGSHGPPDIPQGRPAPPDMFQGFPGVSKDVRPHCELCGASRCPPPTKPRVPHLGVDSVPGVSEFPRGRYFVHSGPLGARMSLLSLAGRSASRWRRTAFSRRRQPCRIGGRRPPNHSALHCHSFVALSHARQPHAARHRLFLAHRCGGSLVWCVQSWRALLAATRMWRVAML